MHVRVQIYMMYNIVLALPVVSLGVFDRDISEEALLSYPFFYVSGRMKLDLNIHMVMFQTLQSIGEWRPYPYSLCECLLCAVSGSASGCGGDLLRALLRVRGHLRRVGQQQRQRGQERRIVDIRFACSPCAIVSP